MVWGRPWDPDLGGRLTLILRESGICPRRLTLILRQSGMCSGRLTLIPTNHGLLQGNHFSRGPTHGLLRPTPGLQQENHFPEADPRFAAGNHFSASAAGKPFSFFARIFTIPLPLRLPLRLPLPLPLPLP